MKVPVLTIHHTLKLYAYCATVPVQFSSVQFIGLSLCCLTKQEASHYENDHLKVCSVCATICPPTSVPQGHWKIFQSYS